MAATTPYLLERVVHQVLKGEWGRGPVEEALLKGETPGGLITDILWPAMECVQQLHRDGTITARVENTALRGLRSLLDMAAQQLPREVEGGRSVFVMTALGERVELGAHLMATLAEGHGWKVHFAGAGLSLEEVVFSIGQLSPDVVLVHGSAAEGAARVGQFVRQLQKICVWPGVQVVVMGSVAEGEGVAGDLVARGPMEALEMMALWPEYRAMGEKGTSLQMPKGAGEVGTVSAAWIEGMMARHFGRERGHLN